MTPADLVKALGRAGADPFIARQALDESNARRVRAAVRHGRMDRLLSPQPITLEFPGVLQPEPDVFVGLEHATRGDLIAAANCVSRRYLSRREPRHYLLSTLWAAAALAPLLNDGQKVGDVCEVSA